jgi:hypothetical protein
LSFVGIAKLAAFEWNAVNFKAEAIQLFFAKVGFNGHTGSLKSLNKLNSRGVAFDGFINQLSQLVSGRLLFSSFKTS